MSEQRNGSGFVKFQNENTLMISYSLCSFTVLIIAFSPFYILFLACVIGHFIWQFLPGEIYFIYIAFAIMIVEAIIMALYMRRIEIMIKDGQLTYKKFAIMVPLSIKEYNLNDLITAEIDCDAAQTGKNILILTRRDYSTERIELGKNKKRAAEVVDLVKKYLSK